MKYLLLILFAFASFSGVGQTTQSPGQIRQEMARIRQTTNWDDPVAAAKANEQIKVLAKMLMAANPAPGAQSEPQSGGSDNPKDAQKLNELNQEMIDQKMDIWSQIWKSAAGGEGADILLAEPLREKIVQEFKEEEDKTVRNQMWLDSISILTINMSWPHAQLLIDQMSNFKGIEVLVIATDQEGTPVDLEEIFSNAVNYPLKEIYILNFAGSVSSLPDRICNFKELKSICLLHNNLRQLPDRLFTLPELTTLYADFNPIISLMPGIISLQNLTELGIEGTDISESEIRQIQAALPQCKIITQ